MSKDILSRTRSKRRVGPTRQSAQSMTADSTAPHAVATKGSKHLGVKEIVGRALAYDRLFGGLQPATFFPAGVRRARLVNGNN